MELSNGQEVKGGTSFPGGEKNLESFTDRLTENVLRTNPGRWTESTLYSSFVCRLPKVSQGKGSTCLSQTKLNV